MTSAEEIVTRLGGTWDGSRGMALCPAHDDRKPSLSIWIAGGAVRVHCFAGCPSGQVIARLIELDLWGGADTIEATGQADRAKSGLALAMWERAVPARGSPAESYLRSRGITVRPPPALRYLHSERHTPSGQRFPVMLAAITGADGEIAAVHRTYLTCDGGGKAPVEPVRMCLGGCRGGAIRLYAPAREMAVAEGIETALSFYQASRISTWASWSAINIERDMQLPPLPLGSRVIIAADGDDAGERAALAGAERWMLDGRKVRIARPPRGMDFNDMLQREARRRGR